MVKLSLPLRDYDDADEHNKGPHCDPSQSIYNRKHCVQNFLFCSDDNPCPSNIPCIDQVCQCLPNKHQYITLTPLPHRMYTVGCNFDRAREAETCREYEYGVDQTCVLNYCSKDVLCYAGTCDTKYHVCVNMTSTRVPLPPSINQIIVLDDTPFGLQKEDGPPPLLYIIAAAGGVTGLAILGCLIRSIIQSVQGSVAWASRNHRLPSEGSEHYDDKDQYSHSITDTKYVADPEAISGVTVAQVPARFTSAHCLLSTYSLDYATPLHSPQVATFAQGLNAGPQSQSQASLAHLNGESSAAIELETRSFLNNPREPTTTTLPIDSSSKLSNEAQMLGQAEELSMLAGEQGTITRLVTVSPCNVSDSSELQKSRSLHVPGSEALPSLPQLPAVATMKGSRSPAVAITTLSNDVSPSPSLSSLKSPRSPRSPKSP
ncbi:hypothetical protein KI688_008554 [Linnemannia hyalina]|uniref:Uncharacterized protein n=1 Tax=Linnemannia hyalina TaxID=64524 RepID=A0A9P7Y471_9FUNG|nr:hypothetical protein KI688_008554 [Linnemannia hyalina]